MSGQRRSEKERSGSVSDSNHPRSGALEHNRRVLSTRDFGNDLLSGEQLVLLSF